MECASCEHLLAIVESSRDAIISKDLNGVITSWNRGAEAIFGYTADEIVGTSITQLLPDEQRQEESQVLDSIRRGERVDFPEAQRGRICRWRCAGHFSEELRQQATQVGIRKVLYKPNAMEELSAAIHQLALSHGSP